MPGATANDNSATGRVEHEPGFWLRPMVQATVAMIVGMAAANAMHLPALGQLVGGAGVLGVAIVLAGRSSRAGWWVGLLAFALLSGSYDTLRTQHVPADSLFALVGDKPTLAKVQGSVVDSPNLTTPMRGPMGQFSYRQPGTITTLAVDRIMDDGRWRDVSGRVILKINQSDHRLQLGQRIEAIGWLVGNESPRNAGEFDYKADLQAQGIAGRLTLPLRGNWTLLDQPALVEQSSVTRLRSWIAQQAIHNLRQGLDIYPEERALLETLLLGHWGGDTADLRDSFRDVGLAHLLSISGAHLGMLMAMVWLIVRLLVPSPPRAALLVLAVLLLYMMAVPLRVPIVRASIMAGLFFAGYATGRRLRAVDLLSLAAMVVLLWRPQELVSAGFQLSFMAVTALLLFTAPVSQRLWPEPTIKTHATFATTAWRFFIDYLSVSIVAFVVVLPIVAYHFQMVNPLAVLMSVLALPVFAALLAVGYAKILLGTLLPSVSLLLAGPLAWIARSLIDLVQMAGDWPGTSIELAGQPSAIWAVAAVAVMCAMLAGWFARRRLALAGCLLILALWVSLGVGHDHVADPLPPTEPGDITITSFMVGDGSCYLVRTPQAAIMFDAGSQAYLDVGERSIVPTLRRMGVDKLDALFVSHADLDHYCAVPDVVESLHVSRVLITPQLEQETRDHPRLAAAYLVNWLSDHAPTIAISRGHREQLRDMQLELLWPDPAASIDDHRTNDLSMVLRLDAGAGAILLNGDIQQWGIEQLLQNPTAINAHVSDIAHHGSFVDASPLWLHAVRPAVLIESGELTPPHRRDPWANVLAATDIQRLITGVHGTVHVRLRKTPNEHTLVQWQTFSTGISGKRLIDSQ